jgi:origin recognition complex subunit 4
VHSDVDVEEVSELLDGTRVEQDDQDAALPKEVPIFPTKDLHCCSLEAQKCAVLSSLHEPSDIFASCGELQIDSGEGHINVTSATQLTDLLTGTTSRGEGNSCLIIGPKGSGKTKVRK